MNGIHKQETADFISFQYKHHRINLVTPIKNMHSKIIIQGFTFVAAELRFFSCDNITDGTKLLINFKLNKKIVYQLSRPGKSAERTLSVFISLKLVWESVFKKLSEFSSWLPSLREKCPYLVSGVILVRIQFECGKMPTSITPNTDTFYAVFATEEEVNNKQTGKPYSYSKKEIQIL